MIAVAPSHDEGVVAKLKKIGISFKQISMKRASISPVADIIYIFKLYNYFSKIRPDMVFSYTMKPALFASAAASLARIPRITCMLTGLGIAFTATTFKARIAANAIKLLGKMFLKRADAIIFHNEDDLNAVVASGMVARKQCHVVNGSGVETNHFTEAELPKEVSFLFIGRLLREKGIREYVDAATALHKNYPDIKCRIVGGLDQNSGSIKQEEVQSWQDKGYIEYIGVVDDVREAIKNCSIFVLPSYREGRPRSTLEAMSMGRGIITSDAPGCRQTVEVGVNGLLAPVGDSKGIYKHMAYFVENPDEIISMGAASRKIAVEKYDAKAVSNHMLELIGA